MILAIKNSLRTSLGPSRRRRYLARPDEISRRTWGVEVTCKGRKAGYERYYGWVLAF